MAKPITPTDRDLAADLCNDLGAYDSDRDGCPSCQRAQVAVARSHFFPGAEVAQCLRCSTVWKQDAVPAHTAWPECPGCGYLIPPGTAQSSPWGPVHTTACAEVISRAVARGQSWDGYYQEAS